MAKITAKMVLELRDETCLGMMDCKAALERYDGDMLLASGYLRHRGCAIYHPPRNGKTSKELHGEWVEEGARGYKERKLRERIDYDD